ncbi:putative dehydrogenase [Deinococcus metalli]|uniref:Deoxyfructose oxidoreductase n=1 Tax=Deinococcus metalli TaxID=1141878 RepID=A0A7W8KFN3_9DEIO|nr:Gfo/Idh/MocA family oxidoreductase [Deinococcus metalli]MBB5377337.1 putative dehydrogenase [Deinococcus metalli]GHF49730.1 deoxyfructose oxidoreductase [Deinococcus metalli]
MTTFRWGILGAARIANRLVPAFRAAGGEVVAVGARDAASAHAQAFSDRWGVPVVGGYQDVLDSDVDAVYIPLPNDLHLPWTVAALRAGKHVLTEKPYTLDAAQAREIAAVAAQTGKAAMEAFAPRFHPFLLRVREIVRSGELGEVRVVRSAYGFSLQNAGDIRWDATKGGGALYDVGTYCVNTTRLLLGEPHAATAQARWTPGGVDLGLSGTLEYAGALVTLDCGFDWGSPDTQRLTIIGTRGTLDAGRVSSPPDGEPVTLTIRTADGPREESCPAADAYTLMATHFQQAAQGVVPPLYPPDDAVAQMRVLDALYESARTGRRIDLQS